MEKVRTLIDVINELKTIGETGTQSLFYINRSICVIRNEINGKEAIDRGKINQAINELEADIERLFIVSKQ